MAERIARVPLPTDEVYDNVERIYQRLKGMKELLSDPERTSIRLVINPERMVIKESQRALTYLSLYGFPVDAVFANRILPAGGDDRYLAGWRDIQAEHLKSADACFSPIPIFKVPMFEREIGGLGLLEDAARTVFGEGDPTNVHYKERVIEIAKKNGEYRMSIHLPFAQKGSVDLWVNGDDLTIRVDQVKRSIRLPRALSGRAIRSAKLEDGRFAIVFEGGTS
jgi:arsenite-transporting ATPase